MDGLTIYAKYTKNVQEYVHRERSVAENYSIADARYNFPRLVREAENGKVVGLTRRGRLAAMLIGQRHYEQLASNYQGFAESYRSFALNMDLANLDIDPERLFSVSRKDLPERTIEL